MQVILNFFWRICLFRAGPEQLPDNVFIATALSVLYVVVSGLNILYVQPSIGVPAAMLAALATLVIMASAMQFLVRLKQHPARFVRGFSALIGCNIVIMLITAPLSYFESQLSEGVILDLARLFLVLSLFWWIAISGFILSRTIGISFLLGIALAYVLEILQIQTINQLFIAA